MKPRYYIREITGFLTPRRGGMTDLPGTTFHIMDRRFNCKPAFTIRTESLPGRIPPAKRYDAAKRIAEDRLAELRAAA